MDFKLNETEMQVDFGYAFSPPHRLTVALPDSSDKTLLDVRPGSLRMAWTYESLLSSRTESLRQKVEWDLVFTPEFDGQPYTTSTWRRAEGWMPALVNVYETEFSTFRLEVVGARTAAIIRIDLENRDDQPHRIKLKCEKPGGLLGYNPSWVQSQWDSDVLLAGWGERQDRVIVFAVGADQTSAPAEATLYLEWVLGPGEARTAWMIRPYQAYHSLLPILRRKDWDREFKSAKSAWCDLIGRAARFNIPEAAVQNAFYAGIADCFIMREPIANGYIATCPGTELYRAMNPAEGMLASLLLDQVGLHEEAGEGAQAHADIQGFDGDWNDPLGWIHFMWCIAGFKAWVVMEHYRLTQDRDYLASLYPRLIASSRWQERQRAGTRVLINGQRPLTYGLLPRGMGDCGLWGQDGGHYGVFLPHNIFAVYADAIAVEAAEILGQTADLSELRCIYETARDDLMQSLHQGAISEEDYKWIPGVAGDTIGSRWGALYAAFPCAILPSDHELISGTIRKIESRMSPGGIPVGTGWMKEGMWVAITLDNLAEVLLLRDDGDAAVAYLYATLNHGTPLYSWCEERGQQPGTEETSGDRQHLWTPVAVGRFLRDALVMEADDTLHLARGAARQWLGSGAPLGVQEAPTYSGRLSYELRYEASTGRVMGWVELTSTSAVHLVLHVRLPRGLRMISLHDAAGAQIDGNGTLIDWSAFCGRTEFEATVLE